MKIDVRWNNRDRIRVRRIVLSGVHSGAGVRENAKNTSVDRKERSFHNTARLNGGAKEDSSKRDEAPVTRDTRQKTNK